MSDTHDNLANVEKAVRLLNEEGVGLVVHLGDYTSPFTVRRLGGLRTRMVGIFGNNDGDKPALLEAAREIGHEIHHWPYTLRIDGRSLLLIHGFGSPEKTVELAESLAASGRWDVVAYGHTHKRDNRRVGRALLINPGEVFGGLSGTPSIALLDTSDLRVTYRTLT